MQKILMKKYGFVRDAKEDFSDDGNRFTCYKVGTRVRVSKHVSDGQVYISARIDGRKLPYEVYSKLSKYKALDRLNGVSIAGLTDADLFTLYEDCLAYEQEYIEAENTIKLPTLEEIKNQCALIKTKRLAELDEVKQIINQNLFELMDKLSDYKWKDLRQCVLELDKIVKKYESDNYANYMLGTGSSMDFCKPDWYELVKEPWYYSRLKDIFKTAGIAC